jgi:hypothetical protein
MASFKVGDKVRRIEKDNGQGACIGTVATVTSILEGDGFIGVHYPGCFDDGHGDGSETWHTDFAELVQESQHEFFDEKDEEEESVKNIMTLQETVRAQAASWFAEYDKHNHFPEMLALDAYAAGYAAAQKPAAVDEALRAEVERLQEIVSPKREDECLTLDHWRMRAYDLEENWSRCSHACAGEQTKREQAEARAERLAEALRGLLNDTQHKDHNCGDTEWCPVAKARAALEQENGRE